MKKGGGAEITVEPILIRNNGEYIAPEGKAYSPVNVQTPVYNITPLTLTHNHQGAEAGLFGGYSPVQVSIEMDTLNVAKNGVYQIDENTQDGWDTVSVDVYEKYNTLWTCRRNSLTSSGMNGHKSGTVDLVKNYDELYITGGFSESVYDAFWVGRHPASVIDYNSTRVGVNGVANGLWLYFTENREMIVDNSSYDCPCDLVGVKNKDRTETILYTAVSSTEPETITLSDSIFNYDEICLVSYVDTGGYHYQASQYYPSNLFASIMANQEIISSWDSGTQTNWKITDNDTLTHISNTGARYLKYVIGIKDRSIQETVLYQNSEQTAPQSITLSDSIYNYDEICIAAVIGDNMVQTVYIPTKALYNMTFKSLLLGVYDADRMLMYYMSSDTNLSLHPSSTSGAFPYYIKGIKRPVANHNLKTKARYTTQSGDTSVDMTVSGTGYWEVWVNGVQELSGYDAWHVDYEVFVANKLLEIKGESGITATMTVE